MNKVDLKTYFLVNGNITNYAFIKNENIELYARPIPYWKIGKRSLLEYLAKDTSSDIFDITYALIFFINLFLFCI